MTGDMIEKVGNLFRGESTERRRSEAEMPEPEKSQRSFRPPLHSSRGASFLETKVLKEEYRIVERNTEVAMSGNSSHVFLSSPAHLKKIHNAKGVSSSY